MLNFFAQKSLIHSPRSINQKLLSRHKEMSEKAKAMMERLKNSPVSMENGKQDANVCFTSHHCFSLFMFFFCFLLFTLRLQFGSFLFSICTIDLLACEICLLQIHLNFPFVFDQRTSARHDFVIMHDV